MNLTRCFGLDTSANSFLYSFQIIFCFKTTENITFIDPDKISRNMLRICLHARSKRVQCIIYMQHLQYNMAKVKKYTMQYNIQHVLYTQYNIGE